MPLSRLTSRQNDVSQRTVSQASAAAPGGVTVRRLQTLKQRADRAPDRSTDRLGYVFAVQGSSRRNDDLFGQPSRATQRTASHRLPRHGWPTVPPAPKSRVDGSELTAWDRHHHDLVIRRPRQGRLRLIKRHGSHNSVRPLAHRVTADGHGIEARPPAPALRGISIGQTRRCSAISLVPQQRLRPRDGGLKPDKDLLIVGPHSWRAAALDRVGQAAPKSSAPDIPRSL